MRLIFLIFFLPLFATAAPPVLWDLDKLDAPPAHRWRSKDVPIQSLFYEGESYQGHDTEVFAFYASPATLAGKSPPPGGFPAVVLIHGGGGTAFAEWVHLWAKRGYAAIAMDLAGCEVPDVEWVEQGGKKVLQKSTDRETRTRLSNGGPGQGHPEKFDCVRTDDIHDDWPFHAISNVIRAHSLIRSFAEVNADRTAVTGISWGGYTTCIVASIDHRFKAAVPVYGCGFLHEGESVQKPSIDRLGTFRDKWIAIYDPSRHLPNCRIPILFVNGSNDPHYPLDSYQKSFDSVPDARKQMRVTVKMPHGHPPGWAPPEIAWFIDSYCRQGDALARPGVPSIVNDAVRLPYTSSHSIREAKLHFTTGTGLRSQRDWTSIEAEVTADAIVAPKPPEDANTWFLTLTDDRGAIVSSGIQFATARESAPAEEKAGFPQFTWDTVPLYQMFADSERLLTDGEVSAISSTSNFICIEKQHGIRVLGGAELGAKYEISRFKEVNPGTKALFYFNSAYAYPFATPSQIFRFGEVSEEYQGFLLKDPETGELARRGNTYFFDVLNPAFREWWVTTIGQCVRESGADGLFVDQMHGFSWLRKDRAAEVRKAQAEMMRQAKEAIGRDKILLLNNGAEIPELFEIGDAFMFEHYNADKLSKEAILKDWELMKKISQAGKIAVWRIGVEVEKPDFANAGGDRRAFDAAYEELSKERIGFYLAAFLIGAQPNCYFQYGWGWNLQTGPLAAYPEFHKPLGKPMRDATRPDPTGWIFKREFEHASVWLDLSTREGKLEWK